MEEDSELGADDNSPQDRSYSRERGYRTDGTKRLSVLLVIALILICAGSMFYSITKRPKATDTKALEPLASRIAALEQKVTGIETQFSELQGKTNKVGTDPFLLHQIEVLTQKVEALEKRGQQASVESKSRPTQEKRAVTSQKKYHTVQKGETLPKIGKKYEISVKELRKLNNLTHGQSIKIGQKLLVSVER